MPPASPIRGVRPFPLETGASLGGGLRETWGQVFTFSTFLFGYRSIQPEPAKLKPTDDSARPGRTCFTRGSSHRAGIDRGTIGSPGRNAG